MLFAVFEINFDVLELYRYDVFIHVVCIVWILFIYVEQITLFWLSCHQTASPPIASGTVAGGVQ